VIVQVSDGSLVDKQVLAVTVGNVNEGPVMQQVSALKLVQEATSAVISLGASDPDGDTLSYTIKAGARPKLGTVTFDASHGTFVYEAGELVGSDSFTVVASDGHGGTTEQTINVAVNTAPITDLLLRAVNDLGATLTGKAGNDIIYGGAGADIIHGGAGRDMIYGGGGANYLYGDDGDDGLFGGGSMDVLDGGKGGDYMAGGDGADTYYVDNSNDRIYETATGGRDTVITSINYKLGANLEDLVLAKSGLVGMGNELSNKIIGSDGADIIYGGDGMDFLYGGAGADRIYGDDGNDLVDGGDGNDLLYGGAGNDTINGGNGDDRLEGGDGNDNLDGGAGNDALFGGDGNDILIGGPGSDILYGGAGVDVFRFNSVSDRNPQSYSTIMDFSRADLERIDLRQIDANVATAADDPFAFIGQAELSHKAGELRFEVVNGSAHVLGDVNGDGVADFEVVVANVTSLAWWDFQL
jgi:Ca2+-binding RTX toxin-like protein